MTPDSDLTKSEKNIISRMKKGFVLQKMVSRKRVVFTMDMFYQYGYKKLSQFDITEFSAVNIGHGRIKDDYISANVMKEAAEYFMEKLHEDNKEFASFPEEFEQKCEEVWGVAERIQNMPLSTPEEILKVIRKYKNTGAEYMPYLFIPALIQEDITRSLRDDLGNWMDNTDLEGEKGIDGLLKVLMAPSKTPLSSKEQAELLEVARIHDDEKQKQSLEDHYKKWKFLSCYNINEKPFSKNYYKKRLNSLSSKQEVEKKQKEIQEFNKAIQKADTLESNFGFPHEIDQMISFVRKLVYLRTYKIDVWNYLNYSAQEAFKQAADLLSVSLDEVSNTCYKEIEESLKNKELIVSKSELSNRVNGYGYLFCGGDKVIVTGNKIDYVTKDLDLQTDLEEITKITGDSAQEGIVKGACRIIIDSDNENRLKQGEVLVTNMTNPSFLPAMKRASAIITDEGGILSHAAITARELDKPCIIATKNATKVLDDGDKVEVDADEGVVKILR